MSPRSLFLAGLVAVFVHLSAPAAMADLGVEKVDRTSGKPGASVRLTLGCGACSAASARVPPSFPVSLVPAAKVPRPHRCGPRTLCPPRVRAVPRRAPFTYLGEALLLPGEEGDGRYPLYVLDFTVPELPAGTYTYVIYCDACIDGKAASLITEPNLNPGWRLRIRR